MRLSVVIPTRNRPSLARLGVEQTLAMVGRDAEVIVADNGDEPLRLSIDDPRLRLLPRPERVLSMTENWERALAAAKGEWLLFLSDKCRLVPGALERLFRLAGHHQIVTYLKLPFRQSLENVEDNTSLRAAPGETTRPAKPRGQVEVRDSKAGLAEWFASLYYCQYLPMLYNSLVHRSLVDDVRRRYGSFFVGTSPDIGSSLLLLSQTREYLETTLPAIAIQFPTRELAQWSNGVAWFSGHPNRQKFLQEHSQRFVDDFHLPETAIGAMAHTLLAFKRDRPELAAGVEFDWARFALVAADEIEGMKRDRWRLHGQLLRATQQNGVDPRAAAQQLRAIVQGRAPRVYGLLRKLRGGSVKTQAAWSPSERHESLDRFLSVLAEEGREYDPPARVTA